MGASRHDDPQPRRTAYSSPRNPISRYDDRQRYKVTPVDTMRFWRLVEQIENPDAPYQRAEAPHSQGRRQDRGTGQGRRPSATTMPPGGDGGRTMPEDRQGGELDGGPRPPEDLGDHRKRSSTPHLRLWNCRRHASRSRSYPRMRRLGPETRVGGVFLLRPGGREAASGLLIAQR
jgi:hypothetical protein